MFNDCEFLLDLILLLIKPVETDKRNSFASETPQALPLCAVQFVRRNLSYEVSKRNLLFRGKINVEV